jgi:VWFA-related protein
LARFLLISKVFLFVVLASAAAQQQSFLDLAALEHGPLPDPTQGLVRLDVEVRDKLGNSVTGLTRQDFTLEDNGQPNTIVSLQGMNASAAATNHSLEIILVLDELDLDGLQLRAAEQEAATFLRQHEGHLAEPVMVYRITSNGPLVCGPPSLDGNQLADQIVHRKQSIAIWGPSAVFETPRAVRSLVSLGSIAIEERRRPGRKLLFWLGPGWQTERAQARGLFDLFTELSTRLREARISLWQATEWAFYDNSLRPEPIDDYVPPVYLAGVQRETRDYGYLGLSVLAAQSGGGVLKTKADISALISKRVEQAKRFYFLTFDPPRTKQVDEYHHVRVQTQRSGVDVFTWTGYFDQPVFYDQPNENVEHVTVEDLEHVLQASVTVSDEQMARRLADMELTERLSSVRLVGLEALLRGKKARQALIALADQSVYLDPPAVEVLATAPPDANTQRQMILRAVQYVNQTLPRLPNFLAERTTILYQQAEPRVGPTWRPNQTISGLPNFQAAPNEEQTWKTATGDRSLHKGEALKVSVVFRGGKEVASGKGANDREVSRLKTIGTFGPVLAIVAAVATAPASDLAWSRWEQGKDGREAVFSYRARPEETLYATGSEYLARDDTAVPFLMKAPFHGEFSIDPESGAILRLTMQADLRPRLPLDESNIMVEYGPVNIGGKTYICPLRSVSISRQRRFMDIHEWGEDFKVYAPFETLLNDMVFGQYHLFHSSARMLPGFTPAPAEY